MCPSPTCTLGLKSGQNPVVPPPAQPIRTQLLLEKPCPPTRCRSLWAARPVHLTPDAKLPVAQAGVCFFLLFCKQGRCTDHTDPAALQVAGPDTVPSAGT